MPTLPTSFNIEDRIIEIKGANNTKTRYLPVDARIKWFREHYPEIAIQSEEIAYEPDAEVEAEAYIWNAEKRRSEKIIKRAKGRARFKTSIWLPGQQQPTNGYGQENAANFTDFYEKAETISIGRALGKLGYGTPAAKGSQDPDFHSRIADTPMPTTRQTDQANDQADGPVSKEQLASIAKLAERLGKLPPEATSNLAARKLIQQLTAEYHEQRAASSSESSTPTPEERAASSRERAPDAHRDAQPATRQQLETIAKLCERLDCEQPRPEQFGAASAEIKRLNGLLVERRQQKQA